MSQHAVSAAITIRTAKVSEIDALASAMDRSRNYIINQAIEQYLEANVWQMERITAGIEAARSGKVQSADEVFSGIAAKHGWAR
ncbi:ribbon-helix-helix protein, CopG family [Ochrobactrum sp. GPK 3]|uniref:CopG family ribbon-helix-helix protein n=1 Tax=Brucella sp. 22210 TaxID=3453892 RepID=UPI0031384B10